MLEPEDGSDLGAVGLVAANLVPLVGVVALGWNLAALMTIYWLELAVVTGTSVAKVYRAEGDDVPGELPEVELYGDPIASFVGESRREIASSIVGFYGFVWVLFGMFVLLFPFQGATAPPVDVALGFAGTVAYHAVSYRVNYVENGEYRREGPVAPMADPRGYVYVFVPTILLGGFAWFVGIGLNGLETAHEPPVAALVVTILVKAVLDVRAYRREHDWNRLEWLSTTATE